MKKWLLVFLLLLAAFWAGGQYASGKATAHAKALADTAAALRDTAAVQKLALLDMQEVVDSLDFRADSLGAVAAFWKRRSGSTKAKWDTVWIGNNMDTIPLAEIRRLGNEAIAACQRDTASCEERLALAKETTDRVRHLADSTQALADTWEKVADAHQKEAQEWRRVARGSLIQVSADGLLNPFGGTMDWQAAADATIGKGRLKALVRFQAGNGSESCAFESNVDAYTCSTPTETKLWLGGRFKL